MHRADCSGLLVYTRDGHMAVQVMYRDPQAHQSGSAQYAQGGYEASFGRYEIDERAHNFTFHVEGALVRSLIGKDLTRVFELSGNQMTVKAANPTALAWLLAQKPWIVPIPGTTKLHRLEENLGAVAVELTPDDLREIDAAASKITIQGARYPEDQEKLTGR